jgi:cytochrome c peroxidase
MPARGRQTAGAARASAGDCRAHAKSASTTSRHDARPIGRHRTSPLRGLWTHCNGGYPHDGRFATLDDVVAYYDARFGLQPDAQDRRDLVECLKSL